jgi:hypothetical protein
VRREDQACDATKITGQPVQRRAHVTRVGLDKRRVIEPTGNVSHLDVAARGRTKRRPGRHDVLSVLLTTGIAMVRGRDESDRTSCSRGPHLFECVVDERVPVAHTYVDRQRPTGRFEPSPQAIGLSPRELGDGRNAPE